MPFALADGKEKQTPMALAKQSNTKKLRKQACGAFEFKEQTKQFYTATLSVCAVVAAFANVGSVADFSTASSAFLLRVLRVLMSA